MYLTIKFFFKKNKIDILVMIWVCHSVLYSGASEHQVVNFLKTKRFGKVCSRILLYHIWEKVGEFVSRMKKMRYYLLLNPLVRLAYNVFYMYKKKYFINSKINIFYSLILETNSI